MPRYFDNISFSIEGSSHSEFLELVCDGLPVGEAVDLNSVADFMKRRSPGNCRLVSKRREADTPEIISGIRSGIITDETLRIRIKNTDAHSSDYAALRGVIRPSHADLAAYAKYGSGFDLSGGWRFSGRMTAPLCFLGAVCLQLLESRSVYIGSHIKSIGTVCDLPFDTEISLETLKKLSRSDFPVLDSDSKEKMLSEVSDAMQRGDSVGGVIECAALGIGAGKIGGELFDGLEGRLSAAVFAVPAVKGIDFGSGFYGSRLYGSQNNDAVILKDGKAITETNRHGGILGGISSGMPIVLSAAIKPTPSIQAAQKTVDLNTNSETKLCIQGRHDPCIALRVAPCIESTVAITLLDMLLGGEKNDA